MHDWSEGHPIYLRICDEYALNVTGFPVDERAAPELIRRACIHAIIRVETGEQNESLTRQRLSKIAVTCR